MELISEIHTKMAIRSLKAAMASPCVVIRGYTGSIVSGYGLGFLKKKKKV